MTDQELIDKELERLRQLPQEGYFSFIHHKDPIEYSDNLGERIEYILAQKPTEERYDRLRHIYHILDVEFNEYAAKKKPLWDEYNVKKGLLWDEYDVKVKLLWDEYDSKVKPLWDEYDIKGKLLWDEYDSKKKPLWDEYYVKVKPLLAPILARIPDCAWDGNTILRKKKK